VVCTDCPLLYGAGLQIIQSVFEPATLSATTDFFGCRLRSTGHKFHRVLKVPVSAQLNSGCQSVGSVVTCLEISLPIYGHAEILRGFLQSLRTQLRTKSQIRQRPLPVQSINHLLQHAMLNSPS